MDDERIVDLYWLRDERAISETASKYESYCMKISINILNDRQDSEENVNDTWLQTWNAIPPNRPACFSAFVGKITRNLAINRMRARYAEKRGGGEFTVSLDELDECTPDRDSVGEQLDAQALSQCISAFLWEQKAEMRRVFVRRYFFCESVSDIAERFGISESKVKSILFRMRSKLKLHLEREGYIYET